MIQNETGFINAFINIENKVNGTYSIFNFEYIPKCTWSGGCPGSQVCCGLECANEACPWALSSWNGTWMVTSVTSEERPCNPETNTYMNATQFSQNEENVTLLAQSNFSGTFCNESGFYVPGQPLVMPWNMDYMPINASLKNINDGSNYAYTLLVTQKNGLVSASIEISSIPNFTRSYWTMEYIIPCANNEECPSVCCNNVCTNTCPTPPAPPGSYWNFSFIAVLVACILISVFVIMRFLSAKGERRRGGDYQAVKDNPRDKEKDIAA